LFQAAWLVALLRGQSAYPDADQSKVPFSKRKPVVAASYLHITAPYHCSLLNDVLEPIHSIALEKQWVFDAADMQIPVHACDSGHDVRGKANLTRYIVETTCVLPVDWPTATSIPGATHFVDFGTGGLNGFGRLAHKNVEGRGVAVICTGALLPQPQLAHLGTRADLFQRELSRVTTARDWLSEFGPRLVRTAHDGKVHIDTRLTRTLGMATVMMAGMTPTTCNERLVAAINGVGYHAEFAGGGVHTEHELEKKLLALAESAPPGQGITVLALLRLRREGVPIDGLCIGGSVPSFDVALEIISTLRDAGIRHVAFKPSNASAIRHVVRIAQAADGFPVILQWTGGRAGGHHSYEDFHQPILETYAAVRSCKNVVLVAGSGFGDAAGTLPYMTGEWSTRFGRAPMPFDGILLGSRIMVAKEAATSLAAKELIVAAAGLPDSEWDTTYDSARGGFMTVMSEYGELNHALETRATSFVKDLHRTVLSQPRTDQPALLWTHKNEIIARLNSDYMRPWFGKKADGRVVDLEDMTYTEAIGRMVELMYVKHQQRWIHRSHCRAVLEFISRAVCRLAQEATDVGIAIEFDKAAPPDYASRLIEEYPAAATLLLASEDVQFFVALCKRRGQKPFPFIP
ncbi:fatty acid synthase alpha subunit Lsd1, partial [Coemansia biformis]